MKTFYVDSSWGTIAVNAVTGDVIAAQSRYHPDCHKHEPDNPRDTDFGGGPTSIANIYRFDVAEWHRRYPTEKLEGNSIDILDLGYWQNRTPWAGYIYEPPAESLRYEFRHTDLKSLSR